MTFERQIGIILKATSDRKLIERVLGSPSEQLMLAEAQRHAELVRQYRVSNWFSHGIHQNQH